ncbi:hypothetical protein MKZ38_000439 [Zalerion maritima]|uniref:Uncharacterized protein n=1 Tax=Zalerion maritima TaxID=339359 RepID=A0AAD5RXX7_9PEZI|nr:hypothetical protein MKZ38_000439 [Zalerion maritima]
MFAMPSPEVESSALWVCVKPESGQFGSITEQTEAESLLSHNSKDPWEAGRTTKKQISGIRVILAHQVTIHGFER